MTVVSSTLGCAAVLSILGVEVGKSFGNDNEGNLTRGLASVHDWEP